MEFTHELNTMNFVHKLLLHFVEKLRFTQNKLTYYIMQIKRSNKNIRWVYIYRNVGQLTKRVRVKLLYPSMVVKSLLMVA